MLLIVEAFCYVLIETGDVILAAFVLTKTCLTVGKDVVLLGPVN